MNKWLIRGLLMLGYGIPFVFLSMYGDAIYDTMLLYALMIVVLVVLCFSVVRSKQFMIVIFGNLLSFIISYSCLQHFYTDIWGWYFKPFTAKGLLVAISIITTLIQLIFVCSSYRKERKKGIGSK